MVDQTIALQAGKNNTPVDPMDNIKKSMQAITDATRIMGRGVGTAASAANAAGNTFAFPNNDKAYK